MTDNLLPCPNPWGQDLDSHKIHLELNDDALWCWACSCGIQGPKRLTQSKATEAWNRRAHMDMGNLQRSEVVHANMILYRIAKLTPAQVAHLYTDAECAEIVAEIQRQRPEAVKPAQPDTREVCVFCGKDGYEGSLHSIEDGPWHHEHCRAAIRAQQEGK